MIQPKDLYRKLAALLDSIENGRTNEHFLFSVLAKMEDSFAKDLHVSHGRLFEDDVDRFLLMKQPDDQTSDDQANLTILNAETVQQVIKNGSYIFNDQTVSVNTRIGGQTEYFVPAGFLVQNPEERWIFMFTLTSGWIREEIEFYFNAVRAQLNFQLQAEAMKNDIQQAALIQQSLLPNNLPDIMGYEIAGRSYPADIVGGDFFDFSVFDDDAFSVAIGDASGHGLPAALLVRDVVTGLRMGVEKEVQMARAIQKLNRVIYRSTLSAKFISMFYAVIETIGNISFVNAGHPPPLLVCGSKIIHLTTTGLILGAAPEISLHRVSVCFEPGAVLVLYSDGLLERFNGVNEEFGLSRLEALIIKHQYKSVQQILELIHKTVFEYGKKARWQDDVTIVIVKKLMS
ncbi:serine/threonine-protein phosphatase [candidate division KSB1 bacterium]|nr:serine/threonine-protein phosphatase [candidate division KSB1 bacterium]